MSNYPVHPSSFNPLPSFSIHDSAAVEQLARRHKLDADCLRRLRGSFYRHRRSAEAALTELPLEARPDFASQVQFHSLTLHSRHDSALDGASKLIFRTAQGVLLETVVLRPASGRTSLCVSSQVGCAAKCGFCATGQMGLARSLSAEEIVDQVVQANQLLASENRRVRSVVFMGMGEPLHNETELHRALELLTDRSAFNLHSQRILVSSVGIPAGLIRLAERWPLVRQAVSLHSARPEVRRRLMPISERHGLEELRAALDRVSQIQGRAVMIEYLLLEGLTDTPDDVLALTEYLRNLPVHINLIPYNPIDGASELVGSSPERQRVFSQALKQAGFRVTTRYSLGADIAAACGQLVRTEHRQRGVPKVDRNSPFLETHA